MITQTNSVNTVPERIAALRQCMKTLGVHACIVPTDDPHMSEYVGDHFKSREFITGFTGSAGTAVITANDAGLWTDSRYWLQATEELDGSGIRLFRDGASDTPSIEKWLRGQLCPDRDKKEENACSDEPRVVCVDGTCISAVRGRILRESLQPYGILLRTDLDPVNGIRSDRPSMQMQEITDLPLNFSGMPREEKLALIRRDMREAAGKDENKGENRKEPEKKDRNDSAARRDGTALILTALDDIAWLFNLRGSDIPCNPVFYSYAVVTERRVSLYAEPDAASDAGSRSAGRFPGDLRASLAGDGIELLPYRKFYEDLPGMEQTTIVLDPQQCSDRILQMLPESAHIVETASPVMLRKCIKNPVEMDGIRSAHVRDGVAMCRFLYWLKQQMKHPCGQPLTELSAAAKLYEFRSAQDLFRGNSFDPIIAYGSHGAIVHYSPSPQTDAELKAGGMLLIDSGGQYLDGTTDITRTVALGPLTEEEKHCFTAVLRGHINLARARFRPGCTGANLDILARQPLWERDLDYGHGTGHGVGAYLNVHEDPLRIHWGSSRDAGCAFKEGMLVSNEPGYYKDGSFGIRHENLVLVVASDGSCAADGSSPVDFLQFETVTLVPIDREGIETSQMQPAEIQWLNAYHKRVYEAIAPHLNEDERTWLEEQTRPI